MRKATLKLQCILWVFSIWVSNEATSQTESWDKVESVFGRKGTTQGGVLKIAFPRSDLDVNIGSVHVEAALALTSWLAFSSMGNRTMVMGDLVLLESEIPAVERSLRAHSMKISAIHNHIIGETPKVMYMHVGGEGEAGELAEDMKTVFAQTATPSTSPPPAQIAPSIDWSNVEKVLGRKGKSAGSVLQFGFPRSEKITENGMEIPPFMGMSTALNIQRLDEHNAAATGDFVLLPAEVDSVSSILIRNGFTITAIHSHMLFESPRLIFLHFWDVDDPVKLAGGLHEALLQTASIR